MEVTHSVCETKKETRLYIAIDKITKDVSLSELLKKVEEIYSKTLITPASPQS